MSKCPSYKHNKYNIIPETNNNDYYIFNDNSNKEGYIIQYCNDGNWVYDLQKVSYPLTCPAKDGFPETTVSGTAYSSCPSGLYGYRERNCTHGGWDIIVDRCKPITTPLNATCPDRGRENGAGIGIAGTLYTVPYDTRVFGGTNDNKGYVYDYCDLEGNWWSNPLINNFKGYCPADGMWHEQETGIDNVQSISCPVGYHGIMTRYCKDNGTWNSISSDYCSITPHTPNVNYKCPAIEGWPETPDGTSVQKNCPSGYTGQMSRYCNNGYWLRVNSSDCILSGTPNKCPANNGFPETDIDKVVKINCPDGYIGTQMRYCSHNGSWSNIYSNTCYLKKCSANENFPETAAGSNYYFTCPPEFTGQQSRYCGKNGAWFDIDSSACQIKTCPANGGWSSTIYSLTPVSKPCPTGYTGNITRVCGLNGWETVDSTVCQLNTCPANEGWSSTIYSVTPISRTCPTGYTGTMTRVCGLNGWETVNSSACQIKTCNANISHNVNWPTSTYSTTPVSKPCPTGYTGEMTRVCGLNGWETVNSSACQLNTCPANEGWSSTTYSLIPVSKSCPTGYTGTVYRTCTESGWSNIESDDCQVVEPEVPKCPTDTSQGYTWPETNAGSSRSASCTGNYIGTMSRVCGSNGQWNNVNTSNCSIPECSANNGFNKTPAGETATNQCQTGYTGSITRICKSDGTWSDPVDNCTIKTCPANGGWSSTTYSLTPVSKSCPTGYTGEMTRVCGLNGWETVDSTACQLITCPANGGWSSTTYSITPVSKSCPTGYTGEMTRVCGLNGWQTVNSTACQLVEEEDEGVDDSGSTGSNSSSTSSTGSNIYCVAEGEWPETLASSTAEIKCNSNSNSMMTRYCKVDGKWDEPVKTACEESNKTMLYIWIIVGVVIIIVILYFLFGRRSTNDATILSLLLNRK